jgi:hypothetical protein
MIADKIIALVGNERRQIDHDVFYAAFEELRARYQADGLSGEELDIAICDELPGKLLEIIGDGSRPH